MNDHGLTLIEDIVRHVEKRGLQTPVLFMLEMFRPFVGCFSILAEGFAPCFNIFLGHSMTQRLQAVFADRQAVDELIKRLEDFEQGVGSRG